MNRYKNFVHAAMKGFGLLHDYALGVLPEGRHGRLFQGVMSKPILRSECERSSHLRPRRGHVLHDIREDADAMNHHFARFLERDDKMLNATNAKYTSVFELLLD
jgi:hypothetical protein